MPIQKILTSLMGALVLLATQAVAGIDLHEGLWEITTQMEMPGMPMQMPASMHRQCLTKQNSEPDVHGQNTEDCKITERKVSGNTLTWTLKCHGKNAMQAVGKITYHGERLEGTITIQANDPEMGTMSIVNRISGRRIGDCK